METQKDSTKVNEELTHEQRIKFWDEINNEKYGWDPTDLNRKKIDVPDYIKALRWAWNRTIYDQNDITVEDKGYLGQLEHL